MGMTPDALVAANRAQAVAETDSFTLDRYRQMAGYLAPGSRILDVGSNTGRGGAVLRECVPSAEIVGVEMVPERAAQAPPGIYASVHVCPLEELRDSGRFDAIVMGELLEHIPYTSIESFLLATLGLLRDGGRVVLTTPNPHYLLLRRRSGGTVLGGAHVSVHCPTALTQLLRHHGFEVECVRGSGKISRALGTRFPRFMYGSYLLVARRVVSTSPDGA